MKSCNSCLFIFMLLIVLIILILIRYCSYITKKEHFTKVKQSDPCNHDNFDKKLKSFYKMSKRYRNFEKKMKEAQDLYDKNYELLIKEARHLENSRNELNNCIRY